MTKPRLGEIGKLEKAKPDFIQVQIEEDLE